MGSLTPEARRVLAEVEPRELQALFQMADELALPQQHAEVARQENALAFQQLLAKVKSSMAELMQENAALQKAIGEAEDGLRVMEAILLAKLKAAQETAKSKKENALAEETHHRVAMTILEEQVTRITSERQKIQAEIQALKLEQQKLQFNDNILREVVKYRDCFWLLFPAVNRAYTTYKK